MAKLYNGKMRPPTDAVAISDAMARTGLTRKQWGRLIHQRKVDSLKMGGRLFIREPYVKALEPEWTLADAEYEINMEGE